MSETAQETVTPTEARLNAARSTIAELEKRIVELGARYDQHSLAMHDKLMRALEQKECAQIALTAERQRREECEAALERLDVNGDSDIGRKLARAYFSRYPS